MEAFRKLNEDDGVTVIQVTHDVRWADYGTRLIELADGWVLRDEALESERTG
jgi:putative ABC transport system ATP-binding protein